MNSEIKAQEQAFEETKQQSEENISNLERQLKDSSAQNKILHDQLAVMGKRIDTIQESKMDSVSQGEVSGNDDETSEQVTTLNKQLSDLREVVNYMRSERDINETQLQSARLSVDRERSSGEMTKKALDEARVELEKLQVAVSSNEKNDLFIETKTKLKNAEEQLILLRDSNKFLREESDSLEGKVKSLQAELTNAQSALKPSDEKCRELEVDKMALEAEKASILREVDVWKQRVTSLVSTYHQVSLASWFCKNFFYRPIFHLCNVYSFDIL
jgi:nucleoprotein TPR